MLSVMLVNTLFLIPYPVGQIFVLLSKAWHHSALKCPQAAKNLFQIKWNNHLQPGLIWTDHNWMCLLVIYIYRESERDRERERERDVAAQPFFCHSAAHFFSAYLAETRLMFPSMLKSVAFAEHEYWSPNNLVMNVLNTLFSTIALFGLWSLWVWKHIKHHLFFAHFYWNPVWNLLINTSIPQCCKQAGVRRLVERPQQSSRSELTFMSSGWII